MEKVIVIVNEKHRNDLVKLQEDAKRNQPSPSGVKRISYNAWLIDIHTSLLFFAGLVNSAHEGALDFSVYEVHDTLQDPKHPFPLDQEPRE